MADEVVERSESVWDLPKSFWVANVMEIIERMAWYGFYALSSVYICGAIADGGLGLTQNDRGIIQGAVTFLIYLFPFVTGALGDRYGYKKMLLIAYAILAPSYALLGQMKTMPTFFAAMLLVGIGASIFKPLVVGTIGRVSGKGNGSLAFGIFYMMVNIGGFAGPLLATTLRSQGWQYVFWASAGWILLNIPILLFFYKEPPGDPANQSKSFRTVMHEMFEVIGNVRFFTMFFITLVMFVMGCKWYTIEQVSLCALGWIVLNILADIVMHAVGVNKYRMKIGNKRFLLFLLLLSSFWIAYNQLFLTLPLYIQDSIDSRPVMDLIFSAGSVFGFETGADSNLAMIFMDSNGGVKPEHFVNVNAFCIICFQVLVSLLNSRMKPLITIMIGIILTAFSFLMIGFGHSPWLIIAGVAIFSFGEMMASPKAKEYTAHSVAPKDKVGLYMGYYMWSNALGSLFGGLLSGMLYKQIAVERQSPELMWTIFASLSLICGILILVYHLKVGKRVTSTEKT